MNKSVILGSSSKSRQHVLSSLKIPFRVVKPDIDEKSITVDGRLLSERSQCDPEKLVLAIAKAKANALLPILSEPAVLITCDQVVFYKGTIREKPTSHEECRAYLASYVNYPAITYGSIVITDTATRKQVAGVDTAKQYFKPIPDDIVDAVIAKGDIMHCAGGFMIDEPLLYPYLDKREGDEDSILGLSSQLLLKLLKELNESV